MKAICYAGIKNVEVKKVSEPKIQRDDDVIIKVTSTAICGSDLHLMNGMMPSLKKGFVLGHETMGIVEEAGKDVVKVKKGDRVIVPFPVACGHCCFCDQGLTSLCDNSTSTEVGGMLGYGDLFGGYYGGQAEFLRVPYANFGPTKISGDYEDERVLFLTDVLPTALWSYEKSGAKAGDTVIILGCGPIGLMTIKWADYFGAGRVIAVDCVGYRLEHVKKYGAETVNIENHENTGEFLKDITHGGADVVIDCVGMGGKMTTVEKIETLLRLQGGSKSAIEISTQAVRKGGTVMMTGVYGARYNMFPLGDFFSRNVTLKMGICPAQTYVDRILKLIRQDKIDATDIITHTLPLEQGKHAYDIFDKKQEGCIKVVLKP